MAAERQPPAAVEVRHARPHARPPAHQLHTHARTRPSRPPTGTATRAATTSAPASGRCVLAAGHVAGGIAIGDHDGAIQRHRHAVPAGLAGGHARGQAQHRPAGHGGGAGHAARACTQGGAGGGEHGSDGCLQGSLQRAHAWPEAWLQNILCTSRPGTRLTQAEEQQGDGRQGAGAPGTMRQAGTGAGSSCPPLSAPRSAATDQGHALP